MDPLLPREPGRRDRHLSRRAIVSSLLVHLAILLALFLLNNPLARVERVEDVVVPVAILAEAGEGGAAGGLAGSSGGSQQADPDMTTATATPEAAAAPEEVADAAEVAEAPAEPVPEAKLQIEAPPATAPAPLVVPPKPREPLPLPPPPKPTVKPTPKPPTQVARQEPSPLPPVEPMPAQPLPRAPTMPLAAPPAPTPGQTALMTGEQPGTAASGNTAGPAGGNRGIGSGTEGRGPGFFGSGRGPGDDYLEKLRRWLARHKKYPPDSLKRKEEGSVMVAFVLARDGTVLSAEIERSSGFPLIDQAVLDMLRNASPVPPIPAHYDGDRLGISMPVSFRLGFFERLF